MRKRISLYVVSFFCLILVFSLSMIIVYNIPNTLLRDNTYKSMQMAIESKRMLDSENGYFIKTEMLQASPDYFTDTVILKRALNSLDTDLEMEKDRGLIFSTISSISGGWNQNDIYELQQKSSVYRAFSNLGYARYWHGVQIIIKPLLVFLNYSQIKFFNMFLFYGLLAICLMKIYKNLGMSYALCLLGVMVMVKLYIIPMTLQFPPVWIVTFLAILTINYMFEKNKLGMTPYILFVVGCLTNFFDLLTTPLVSLGIPLSIAILLLEKQNNPHMSSVKKPLFVVKSTMTWGLGYSLTWLSKWCIASLILGENIISEAVAQILVRSSGDMGAVDKDVTAVNSILTNVKSLFIGNRWLGVLIIVGIVATIITILFLVIKYKRGVQGLGVVVSLGLITILPILWFCVLQNHSIVHFWFTNRILTISMFAGACAMIYLVKIKREKNDIKSTI